VKVAIMGCALASLRPQVAVGLPVVASLRRCVPSFRACLRFGGMSAGKTASPALPVGLRPRSPRAALGARLR
jgi:hypothetical protein